MFSMLLGAGLGIRKGDRVPQGRVVEAQTTGGECCKRYDLVIHLPAEEWSPSSFVRTLQWKKTIEATHVPVQFSVEYCAGLNLEGPCSSYNGEITIDGVLQELGGSNGGTASWPAPYCNGNTQGNLVELEVASHTSREGGEACPVDPLWVSTLPCFFDTDHRLTIAEKIFQGQTKRFRRIFLYQDPAADPSSGNPPRLLQRLDLEDPNQPPLQLICGPDVDQYFMIARPWMAVYHYQFNPIEQENDPWNSECHFETEACFAYRFFPLP